MTTASIAASNPPADDPDDLRYPNHVVFFQDFLAPAYARDLDSGLYKWCAKWRYHPEANERIDSLWRAYEIQSQDSGTGMAKWWVQWADPIMHKLMDPTGCFSGCGPTRHTVWEPLPDY